MKDLSEAYMFVTNKSFRYLERLDTLLSKKFESFLDSNLDSEIPRIARKTTISLRKAIDRVIRSLLDDEFYILIGFSRTRGSCPELRWVDDE